METGKRAVVSSRRLDDHHHTKIRILLCDINIQTCQETSDLLCKYCSNYQVAAVSSAREVFDTLDSEGPRAHIILAEVNFLMENDACVLRHINREKQLKQIPLIILTTPNDISVAMKGMMLGASDYLLKPLQGNELANLWMHLG